MQECDYCKCELSTNLQYPLSPASTDVCPFKWHQDSGGNMHMDDVRRWWDLHCTIRIFGPQIFLDLEQENP